MLSYILTFIAGTTFGVIILALFIGGKGGDDTR